MAHGCGGAALDLKVRVADAQGLRLMRGGEIRLVLTLRAQDDPQGEEFGAKVTPWLPVPEGEAPQWRAREAVFTVAADRCFQAEFVDTAHLHIELMQKGHQPSQPAGAAPGPGTPPQQPTPPAGGGAAPVAAEGPGPSGPPSAAALAAGLSAALRQTTRGGTAALSAALHGASSALPVASLVAWPLGVGPAANAAAPDRGEVVGSLWIPVGKRLVRAGGPTPGGGPTWVELVEGAKDSRRVKGSLLLEIAASHRVDAGLEAAAPHHTVPAAFPPGPMDQARQAVAFGAQSGASASAGEGEEDSDCDSRSGGSSAEAATDTDTDSTSTGPGLCPSALAPPKEAEVPSGPPSAPPPAPWEAEAERSQVSALALAALLVKAEAEPAATWQPPPSEWQPFGRGAARPPTRPVAAAEVDDYVTIFSVNNPAASPSASPSSARGATAGGKARPADAVAGKGVADAGGAGRQLRSLLGSWARPRAPRIGQRLRSTLDPAVRKGRREVRKWRRRHEIFVVLNEMERCLGEASRLLMQAAASMRRFGESHGALQNAPLLSAFLCDAALYFRSEAEVPRRLEAYLADLERIADDFRMVAAASEEGGGGEGAAVEQADGGGGGGEEALVASLRRQCVDLQVDIAVLLESALMTAQQALAEYKKLHCRLELVATEYEPLCRLELDISARPVFLPLLADETTKAEAASLPAQAVQWALDFSQLVGSSSRGLEGLVRELEQRRRRLSGCAAELRESLLRRAALAGGSGHDGGPARPGS